MGLGLLLPSLGVLKALSSVSREMRVTLVRLPPSTLWSWTTLTFLLHSVRVLLATANSTTANATVSSAASFVCSLSPLPRLVADPVSLPQTQVLSESATFSSSGNLCLPITFPAEYITGARATLYVEATGEGETVSSCAGASRFVFSFRRRIDVRLLSQRSSLSPPTRARHPSSIMDLP